MKRAVIYARVSTDIQSEKGYSLPSQIDACIKYAHENGYEIVAEFTDDYSGSELNRPGLNDLRQLLGSDSVNALIVYSGDRLTRDLAHSIELRREFSMLDVELCKVLGGQVDDSPQGRFAENVYGAVSQLESELIVERTQRGKNQRAKSGKFIHSGYAPFGYKRVGKGRDAIYEIDPVEAQVVINIYKWYTVGDGSNYPMSLRAIAIHLNDTNTPGPHNCVKSVDYWNPFTVGKILTNEIYAGRSYWGKTRMINKQRVYIPREKWIAIDCPELAIIDRTTFDAARKRRERNKMHSKRNRKYNYLLTGYLKCGACGYAIGGHARKYESGKIGLYYRCGSQWKQFTGVPQCGLKALDTIVHKVDDAVWDWIKNLLYDPQALEDGMQEMIKNQADEITPKHNRLKLLDSLAKEEDKKIKRLIAELGYHNDDYVISALRAEIDQSTKAHRALMEEHGRLVQELAQTEFTSEHYNHVVQFASRIRHKLAEASFEDKRGILDMLQVRGILHYDEKGKWLELSCAIPNYVNDIAIDCPPSEARPQDQGTGGR